MTSITPSSLAGMPAPAWTPPAPAHTRTAAGAGLTPADLLRVIRQRFFLIFFVLLLGMAATVWMTALVQRYYPLYTAERLVQITSLAPTDPSDPFFNKRPQPIEDYDRLLQDQAMLATSSEVISRTL